MARRKKGNPVHGWLVLDKPYDLGSTEAVSKAKWLLEAQKAGHAGTLDPLATGVLPIAFGEATKTVAHVQDGLKRYRFTARWGIATDTDDLEGKVIAESDRRPSREEIENILPRFTGEIRQRPPAFSAVKIMGERAYDLARDGEDVVVPERDVLIESLELLDTPSADEAVFEAVTGKGTYIRALVRDIGEDLITVAHVSALRRTAVGPFSEAMAVRFEDMTGKPDVERLSPEDRREGMDKFLVGIEHGMAGFPQVSLDRTAASKLQHGNDVILPVQQMTPIRQGSSEDIEPILALEHDTPVALCRLEGLKLRPVKVFNL